MAKAAAGVLASRRLTLDAAALALFVHKGWLQLPPGFPMAGVSVAGPAGAGEDVDEPTLRDAARKLADRGVVVGSGDEPLECRPVAAIAGNLAVLADPQAMVHVEVAGPRVGSQAVYAVAGQLGASLFVLADGAAELSLFPAVALGRELVRAVPPAADLRAAEANEIAPALGGSTEPPQPLSGRVPLAALADRYGSGEPSGAAAAADALGMSRQQADLAAQVHASTIATLRCVVTGRIRDGVVVGQVVWLATRDGWVGLRPDPGKSRQPTVALQPVGREELGLWLAPHLTQILEAASERR